MSETTLSGGCLCRKVRYRLTGAPMFVQCCHCRDCQHSTGSAFVVNAMIETDRIVLESGEPAPMPAPTASGRPHDVYRCNSCGAALWSDYGRRPNLRFVRVGTLDEPAACPPNAHIFTRSKLPWVLLPPEAPAFDVYYRTHDLWPADSLARRSIAVGDV